MTATPAASVGVMMPPYIPPRIMIGMSNAGVATQVFFETVRKKGRGMGFSSIDSFLRSTQKFTTTRRKVRIKPGTTVARKHFSTDSWPTQAYSNCAALGGINSPRGLAEIISAAENPRGYLAFCRCGMIIEPMQVSVAAPLPEIDPNRALAITAAALKPPRRWPKSVSAISTIGLAILPFCMM